MAGEKLSPQRQLQRLIDEREITNALVSYFRGVDRDDDELALSVFHEDAIRHHGATAISVAEQSRLAKQTRISTSTMHCLTNVVIHIKRDIAWVESYVLGLNYNEPGSEALASEAVGQAAREATVELFGGRYFDRFERRDGEWKIAERTVVLDLSHAAGAKAVRRWVDSFPSGTRGLDDYGRAFWASAGAETDGRGDHSS